MHNMVEVHHLAQTLLYFYFTNQIRILAILSDQLRLIRLLLGKKTSTKKTFATSWELIECAAPV